MLFELNPNHPGGKFTRTIRLPDAPARVCRWTGPGVKIDLNAAEQAFVAGEIARHVIGPAGKPFPPAPTPPNPKLYPGETPRDHNFDPIEESTIGLSGWQRCLRDLARRANGSNRF